MRDTVMHEVKILPQYYRDVLCGVKNFELRKDDRDYQVGDLIRLREWEDDTYTGRDLVLRIRYVLRDCQKYGLMEGYCILGF